MKLCKVIGPSALAFGAGMLITSILPSCALVFVASAAVAGLGVVLIIC